VSYEGWIADVVGRLVRAREAIEDGEAYLATSIVADLEADLLGEMDRLARLQDAFEVTEDDIPW
jgi:hypothetical protein